MPYLIVDATHNVSVVKMALSKSSKSKVKKVVKGLNKASKLHAGQAKTLKGIMKNGTRKISKKS